MTYDYSKSLRNSCSVKKDSCINCHSHFMNIRPHIRGVTVTKHFFKDIKNTEEAQSIVKDVLDCSNTDFSELHKYEKHIDGNILFRAKKEGIHIVYCVDKNMRIIFLRAFRNFKEYERFLEDNREIQNLIAHA
jgi:mRNA-degrading endonuclease RelE of RelBE toxin-antitoxin system